ncbi:nonstructural protein [Microviridae sp.]|nr:nonstructural protein [Microviridae sp.]
MILNKYTIFDSALEAYHQDYSLENDAIALRQFADMANEETQIAKNPEDYSLWHIGTFETTTGELTPIQPVCLAKAHEHVLKFKHDKKKPNSK